MEYDIVSFTETLISLFVNSQLIPDMHGQYTNKNGYTQSDKSKHPNRPEPRELRKQIENSIFLTKTYIDNMRMFDIGNENMERNFPYYHILQNTPVIRKAHRGTTKTKGTQMYEKDLGKRDYEKVSWNGKTFTKEYSRNVRGSRINLSKTTMRFDDVFLNSDANQYLNVHYKYIDRICDEIAPQLAERYSMKLGRKQDTGLIDEYANQEGTTIEKIEEIFGSFME